MEITGYALYRKYPSKVFLKFLTEDLFQFKYQYKLGLNIDTNPFNANSFEASGGLHFTSKSHIFDYQKYGSWIAFVEIPYNARVCEEIKKWKADRIIITQILSPNEYLLKLERSEVISLIEKHKNILKYLDNQKDEECIASVKKDGLTLRYVKDQTEDICLYAVSENGLALEHVIRQTPSIRIRAVSQNGYALWYVDIQTEDICIAAVSQNGLALQYVKKQNLVICKTAIKQNIKSFIYVDDEFLDDIIIFMKKLE